MNEAFVQAYNQHGFAGLSAELEHKLEELGETPNFHCMLRHLLESILRISNLAPIHEQKAEAIGMLSTRALSLLLVRLHLLTLEFGVQLDRFAAPVQADGVPIICRDVPPIIDIPLTGG